MVLFWRLILGHLLADFTFQTDAINQWKRTTLWGMILHCAFHPLCMGLLTYPFLNQVWIALPHLPLTGWSCLLIIFVAHFIEDQWRVFEIFKFHTPDNTVFFIWDQLVHYVVMAAVVPLNIDHHSSFTFFPERWVLLGCLFVLVTHATTVLLYFVEKDLYGRHFPTGRLKYVPMAHRLILSAAFLLPGLWWEIVAPACLFAFLYWHQNASADRRRSSPSPLDYRLGLAIAVVCGILGRLVYY